MSPCLSAFGELRAKEGGRLDKIPGVLVLTLNGEQFVVQTWCAFSTNEPQYATTSRNNFSTEKNCSAFSNHGGSHEADQYTTDDGATAARHTALRGNEGKLPQIEEHARLLLCRQQVGFAGRK